MSNIKNRVIVSAIIEDENNILFGRKRENIGPYPNTWHLIGGGIEDGEQLRESLKREVREETSIEVEIEEAVDFDDDFEPDKRDNLTHYIFLVYKAKYISGELKADDDIEILQWFPKNKLPNEMSRPSQKLFRKLGYIN